MSIVFLDPTGGTTTRESGLAPRRVRTLNGKTVGLLNNTKVKADYILDAVSDLLAERYSVKEFVRVTKEHFARPMSEQIADDMASRCDVIITAIGSCGACSVGSVADAIMFEQRGVQAAAVLTDAFIKAGDAMARRYGMNGYRYATLPHPVENLSREESRERVGGIVEEIASILGLVALPVEDETLVPLLNR